MKFLIALIFLLSIPSISESAPATKEEIIKINSAIVGIGDKSFEVKSGWYIPDSKAKLMAQGTQNMSANLRKTKLEKDAYIKAYNEVTLTNEKLSELLKDMYDQYDRRVAETENLLKNYQEQLELQKTQNQKLKRSRNTYRTTTILLILGGGVAALCR